MKRQAFLILGAVAVLAACDGFKEAMSAHQDVVARASSQELSVERLAELLGNSKVPLRPDVGRKIADLWADYQLLGAAAARNDSLNDPKMVDSAMWSAIANERARKYYDQVSKTWNVGDAAQNEARYNQGDMLAASHILFIVPPQGLSQARKDSIRKVAESVRAKVTPANFKQMAAQYTQEPGGKERSGSLGIFPKGAMVPQFEQAVLALKPGQISPVIQTQFGYHIIYRPRFDEVKNEFAQQANGEAMAQAEQTFLKKLEDDAKVEIKPNAAQTTKAVAADLPGHADDKTVVATYKGGELTAGKLSRWIAAFPPQANIIPQIQQAPDSVIPNFVRNILRNELVLKAADSAGVKLDSAELGQIRQGFASGITRVWQTVNIDPKSLADSGKTPAERERVAAGRVETYMDKLLAEQAQFADVPSSVELALRDKYSFKINQAGLDRALERAARVRAVSDSTRRAQQPQSQVPMPQMPMGRPAQPGQPQPGQPQPGQPQPGQPQPAPTTRPPAPQH